MSSLLSNAAALSSIGVMVLSAAIVVVAVWTAVLSVKVSKLKRMVLMEQERSAELAQRLASSGRSRAGAPGTVTASGMPAERSVDAVLGPAADDAERSRKPKGRKGKPTIPFGANKEAQSRAQRAYADMADSADFDPDSIDFDKVEGLRTMQVGTVSANAHPVRPASPAAAGAPRQRKDARMLDQQRTGRMPTVATQQATAETKASFSRVSEELRSRNGTSSAWVEEDARRVVERHERAARRQRLSERRQHEQLRRQAESIVAEHHRQMSEVNATN